MVTLAAPEPPAPAADADAFDDLANDARTVDAGGRPGAAPVDPAAVEAGALAAATAEAREVVELAASLLLPFVRWRFGAELADAYGKAEVAKIGDALGAVAHKRGWSIAGAMAAYGPELALAAALVGPALPLLIARARSTRPDPQPDPQPQTEDDQPQPVE